MNPAQLTQMIAAPLASIFLILSLCAFHLQRAQSAGERLILTKVVFDCGDGRPMFFRLGEDQIVEVNSAPMPTLVATSNIAESMKNRAEKVVYFSAAANVSIGNVETVLAKLRRDTPDMFIFAVTSRELNIIRRTISPPDSDTQGKDACIAPVNPNSLFDPSKM